MKAEVQSKWKFKNKKGMMPPRIDTPRLILRPFAADDIAEAYEVLEGNPDVWKYDPGYQRSLAQRSDIIMKYSTSNLREGEGTLAIIHKGSVKLIGYVGLQLYILPQEPLSTPEVELYYKLGRNWWGQGYAIEACQAMIEFAFKEMRLARIVTITSKENVRSINLMRKIGMKLEDAPPKWPGELVGILINPIIKG
jgi:RimJ/RimL family protein N-acetyltransferase